MEELMAAVGCWRRKKNVYKRERERERERSLAQSPREVVGRLLMVEMVVVRVLVVEGHGGERERKERK
jgi:hypothetical protein